MAEEIVACPGCGKKFRIPEGAASGTFQCTACQTSVPYGKGAAPIRAGAAAPAAKAGRAAPAAGPTAAKAVAGKAVADKAGGRTASKRMRTAHSHSKVAHGKATQRVDTHEARKSSTKALVLAITGGVILLGVAAWAVTRKDAQTSAPPLAKGTIPSGMQDISGTGGPVKPPVDSQPVAPAEPVAPAPTATTEPPKPKDSGIGGASSKDSRDYGQWFRAPDEQTFIVFDSVAGTTPEERAEMDKMVTDFVDRTSGRPGIVAEGKLERLGRKAIPALLSVFKKHYEGQKWKTEEEQFAAYQVQVVLRRVVKASGPPSDFVAKFTPHVEVPPEHFQRAAKMWTAWWLGGGKDLETFKPLPEEE